MPALYRRPKMKSLVPITLVFAAVLASACNQGLQTGSAASSSAAATADYSAAAGNYSYLVTSTPVNDCWAPPKTEITSPMTVGLALATTGNQLMVTTTDSLLAPVVDVTLTLTSNALSGVSNRNIPVSQLGVNLDCILNFQATTTGTLTTNNVFTATVAATVSKVSGLECFLLVGTTQPQLDKLPCNLTAVGTATLSP